MSVPGNINPAPPPSSFDNNPDFEGFFEESRWAKLRRKLLEEPLLPFGCCLTVWALLEAGKSIRAGDKHKTNRMFRRRIYAQGFTLVAMVAGSFYWEGDRAKRREYDELTEEKKKQERREAWVKELEARDQEEDELRRIRDKVAIERIDAQNKSRNKSVEAQRNKAQDELKSIHDKVTEKIDARNMNKDNAEQIRSVLEDSESSTTATPILSAARALWRRQ